MQARCSICAPIKDVTRRNNMADYGIYGVGIYGTDLYWGTRGVPKPPVMTDAHYSYLKKPIIEINDISLKKPFMQKTIVGT